MKHKNKKTGHKVRNILLIIVVGLLSFGIWVPNYLIIEDGINVSTTSEQLFKCLIQPKNWQKWGAKWNSQTVEFKVGENLELTQLMKGSPLVIEELVEDEYINFQGKAKSLALQLENEGTQTWLSITVEEKLGSNPLKKLMRHFFHGHTTQQLKFNLKLIVQTCH